MSRCLIVLSTLLVLAGCEEQATQQQPPITERPEPLEKPAPQEMTKQQVLKELAARLETPVKEICPEAEFTTEADRLIAGFRFNTSRLYSTFAHKRKSPWFEVTRPQKNGFLLEVRFIKENRNEKGDMPLIFEDSEKITHVKRFALEWSKPLVLEMTLQRGCDFDPAITEKIEPAIAAYAKERK